MKYPCPICGVELNELVGNGMHPNDPEHGITLDCGNAECEAQEAMGHGDNVKEAWEVISARFQHHTKNNKK